MQYVIRPSSSEPALAHLSLALLEQQCRTEIAAFQRSRSASPERSRAQYELFRRALVLRDEAAWVVLYTLYEHLVNRWLWTTGGDCSWLTSEECDALVNLVMSKFARAITAENFAAFAHLSALLGYLRTCAFSVLTDEKRTRARKPVPSSFESEEFHLIDAGGLDHCLDDLAAQTLRTLLLSLLDRAEERVFLIATYRDGDTPKELVQHYPQFFPSLKGVYAIRQRVLKRLQRHRAVRAYRAQTR